MKRLFLIRHAKSSWGEPGLDDFDRPLNKRGKRNGPEMAARLSRLLVVPDLILASPAKRAKKTAYYMAKGTGYPTSSITFDDGLYLGSLAYHLRLLEKGFKKVETLFLVGHNYTITELSEYLCGVHIANVPTCGVVAIEYSSDKGFSSTAGSGKLLFFDFPKTYHRRNND
ncbi:MAG: phosphohistidine phosphatase [Desulforhopalus sp.]|jgi:phosphohistidine phosphatase